MRDRAPLPLNFALTQGYVAFMGGTKIWLKGDDEAIDEIDVIESPEMIAGALKDVQQRLVSDGSTGRFTSEQRVH